MGSGNWPLYSSHLETHSTGPGRSNLDGTAQRELSVVVGAVEASRSIAPCIDSIIASCAGIDAEIIIVEAGSDRAVQSVALRHPGLRHLSLDEATLTPRLWSEGIALSAGRIVALLTAHCEVSREWASALVAEISSGAAAAGGPIEMMNDASILDSAIYFLRYSAYMARPGEGDIAGDNAAYLVATIPSNWSREKGFWERDVNRALVESGQSIAWAPSARVAFGRSFTFASICRHRFEHARIFGAGRAAGEGRARVIVASPLVPFVLAVRAARRVIAARRYRLRFIASLPALLAMATCWAAGEAFGAAAA